MLQSSASTRRKEITSMMADLSLPKQIPVPTDGKNNQTEPLLKPNSQISTNTSSCKLSYALIFLSFFLVSAFPVSSASNFITISPRKQLSSSNPKKLHKPVVLMISSDGFRFGYQFKTETPNIHRLINTGTEAKTGLIPVYPTMTFPNHYSIVTGLYPAYHGIIMNRFTDPITGKKFTTASHEPEWWLGEPLWVTAVNQGLKAAAVFWAGSEVHKGSWNCPRHFCPKYNSSVSFETRVDTILNYFDLPEDEIPDFMALYFSEPDLQGHSYGPDDPRVTKAVAKIDEMIGRLILGLESRGIFEEINIIFLGDHGMVGTCDKKMIYLDEIGIPAAWVDAYSPVLAIRPRWGNGVSAETAAKKNTQLVENINEALNSGKVENGEFLKVYLKENLPERLHYSSSYRIAPIIGMVDEGFTVKQTKSTAQECEGSHGYDNKFFSMRTVFVGHGPRFAKGKKVESFENVQIYNVVTKILNLKPAANNGSSSFAETILSAGPVNGKPSTA